MIKKILFLLFAAFLVSRTIELLQLSSSIRPEKLSWGASLAFAFMLNLFVTGIFAFPGFVFPTGQLLPHAYCRVRHPQILNTVYQVLAVHYFRKALLLGFWGKAKNRKRFFNGTKAGIQQFNYQTIQSEFGHAAALVLIFALSFVVWAQGHLLAFAFIHLINFIGNFYPVVLQRKHRAAIQRLLPADSSRALPSQN